MSAKPRRQSDKVQHRDSNVSALNSVTVNGQPVSAGGSEQRFIQLEGPLTLTDADSGSIVVLGKNVNYSEHPEITFPTTLGFNATFITTAQGLDFTAQIRFLPLFEFVTYRGISVTDGVGGESDVVESPEDLRFFLGDVGVGGRITITVVDTNMLYIEYTAADPSASVEFTLPI